MLKYILRRLLQLIPTLFLVSVVVFLMVRIIPGDPITLLYGVSEGEGVSEGGARGGVEVGGYCYGMVSNTVSVGGFKGTPAQPVALDDGIFEVVLVRQPQNPLQLQAIIKALLTMSPDEGGLVTSYRTSRLKITCGQELPWTLDGEYGGSPAAAEIVNCRRAVSIVYGK